MLEVLVKAEVVEIQAPSNDDVGAQCAQPVVKMDVLAPMTVMEIWAMAEDLMEILALSTVEICLLAMADDNREKEIPKLK